MKLGVPALALLAGFACATPVPTGASGCEVEIMTRPEPGDGIIRTEVWVTVFGEDRVLSIPSCVGVVFDGNPTVPCTEDGEPDVSACEPATWEQRADTSLRVAVVETPIAGDACNDPLAAGSYAVAVMGIETGDAEVCRLYGVVPVFPSETGDTGGVP